MRRAGLVAVVAAAAACGSFQDPNVVVDIRVIAMEADTPEQVIAVDLANPPTAGELLAQVKPATMCALIADPYNTRRLAWSMTICPLSGDERCNQGDPQAVIGSGFEDDPDVTQPEPTLCATVLPDADLLAVVESTLANDQLHGLDGIDYEISLRVGGEGGDPALDLFASKSLRLAPTLPVGRVPNTNPALTDLDAAVNDGGPAPIQLGRCVDQPSPLVVAPGDSVRLTPVEAPGAREPYSILTIDGKTATFTESLTYGWSATYGNFSSGFTGGPTDAFGNPADLFTDWNAPTEDQLTGPTNVELWVVQRDERLGAHWYQTCVRVSL